MSQELPDLKNHTEEFTKPELAVALNKEVLASLAEQYPDQREMFERFSQLPPMKFEQGKVSFIFGPNGCGKSTLANAIFLAAQVAHSTERRSGTEDFDFETREVREVSPEEARERALKEVLHPSRMTRYALAEMVGMAAAPRLVEDGALTLTQFQARKGFGSPDSGLKSDTPIVHRIAVQDMLGEERQQETEYLFADRYVSGAGQVGRSFVDSRYVEDGASARQTIERKLKQEFERLNPGSIVIMDEAAFGLSPKRQEEYIKMLEQFAEEKDLIIIAPENSGYAYTEPSLRIDLEAPEHGLHLSEAREDTTQNSVTPLESPEPLPEAVIDFKIDHKKIQQLAEENPKFQPMLEAFAKLPPSIAFGPGKTEIFADNGGGKTTLLGVMYLLMEIERRVQNTKDTMRFGQEELDEKEIREGLIQSSIRKPAQLSEKVFVESIGFARDLILSGAITLTNIPVMPKSQFATREGVIGNMWMNLLDVSGEIKKDTYNIIQHSKNADVTQIRDEIKNLRRDRKHGSTRQTSEDLLLQTIKHMPKGGFLFVDEIDGGISPGRQLQISDTVNKLAMEKGVTVVATSNSYEGSKYRLTPSLDLLTPEKGVMPPTHKLK